MGLLGKKSALEMRTPLARSDELVVERTGEELLVYDARTHAAHCLSESAASVWRACDGRTTIETLISTVGLDREAVLRSLQELEECELLEIPKLAGMTRREASIKAAKVAGGVAVATPLIYSITAPAPAAAATEAFCLALCPSGCGGCSGAGCCCCDPGGGNLKVCALTCELCCSEVADSNHCNEQITSVSCSSGCDNPGMKCGGTTSSTAHLSASPSSGGSLTRGGGGGSVGSGAGAGSASSGSFGSGNGSGSVGSSAPSTPPP